MKRLQRVSKGKPGSLLEEGPANEVIDTLNRLLGLKVVVDPLLSTNSSRLEDNGTGITLVIGLRK